MNPRAAINDLLPFQGSPFGQLGYFSKLPYAIASFFSEAFYIISRCFSFVKNFFTFIFILFKQRREWDSNPRALADKRFSRPPRYDHFDISPYALFSVRHVSCQTQDVFYHQIFLTVNTNFYIFSIFFQKHLCHVQILRCCDLYILIRALYKSYFYPTFLFHNHSIICNRTHIFLSDTLMRFSVLNHKKISAASELVQTLFAVWRHSRTKSIFI